MKENAVLVYVCILNGLPLKFSMAIIIFTQFYPYNLTAEYTFVNPEIHRLAQQFDKIIVVPKVCQGEMLPLPPNVEVNTQYADFLRTNSNPIKVMQTALVSDCFFSEIRSQPSILLYPSKILKLVLFSARIELTKAWLTNLLRTQHMSTHYGILYSYWFDHTVTAFGAIKPEFPTMEIISRAHGYDIYEEQYYPYYWPCRPQTLEMVDMIFSASDAGRNYLCKKYPEHKLKFEMAHLGTEDPAFVARSSTDGVFRIVTCSYIVPVKRLHLLLDAIAMAARSRPAQMFEWIHMGDGKGRKALERRMAHILPTNVVTRLKGHLRNDEVMQIYRDQPIDVFVNVSRTEGIPVSIMEAISCGIPIVATSVGGNPEIVSEQNGILLSPDPQPEEIAAALLKIWDNPSLAARLRSGARQVWETGYNAEVNFRAFAERLRSIGESS